MLSISTHSFNKYALRAFFMPSSVLVKDPKFRPLLLGSKCLMGKLPCPPSAGAIGPQIQTLDVLSK